LLLPETVALNSCACEGVKDAVKGVMLTVTGRLAWRIPPHSRKEWALSSRGLTYLGEFARTLT
jgi:hypothetical protein